MTAVSIECIFCLRPSFTIGGKMHSLIRILSCLIVSILLVSSSAGCGSSESVATASQNGGITVSSAPKGSDAQTEYMSYTQTAELNDSYLIQLKNELSMSNVDMDFVNAVIEDHVITADEMNESERRAISCLSKYDMKPGENFWFIKNGGIITNAADHTPEESHQITNECLDDTAYSALKNVYLGAVRNPDNIDLEPYRFQCYKDYKLIDQDYSYEQFKQELDNGKSPLSYIRSSSTPGYDDFMECVTDPLHHMKSK